MRALGSVSLVERTLWGSRVPASCPGMARMEREGRRREPGQRWLCLSYHHSYSGDTPGVIYGIG